MDKAFSALPSAPPSVSIAVWYERDRPESVTGGTTGATAQMVEWDAQEGWIKLKSPTATFAIGETIMGSDSGATMVLDNRDEMATTDTKYSDSVTFENLGDDILDFSETNPFGVMT